jgi:hypothetical protein
LSIYFMLESMVAICTSNKYIPDLVNFCNHHLLHPRTDMPHRTSDVKKKFKREETVKKKKEMPHLR